MMQLRRRLLAFAGVALLLISSAGAAERSLRVQGPLTAWSNEKLDEDLSSAYDPCEQSLLPRQEFLEQIVADFPKKYGSDAVIVVLTDDVPHASRAASHDILSAFRTRYEGLLTSTLGESEYKEEWLFSVGPAEPLAATLQTAAKEQAVEELSASDDYLPSLKAPITLIDLSKVAEPLPLIEKLMASVKDRPFLFVLSGPSPLKGGLPKSAPKRRLPAAVSEPMGGRQLGAKGVKAAPREFVIKMNAIDFPASLFMLLFVVLAIIGVSCLANVDTPAFFDDKTMTINKEF